MSYNPDNFFNTSNGRSLAELSEHLSVPQSLVEAMENIRHMAVSEEDEILVEMRCIADYNGGEPLLFWAAFEDEKFCFSWDWIIDKKRFEKLKRFHNSDCLDIYNGEDGLMMECCSLKTADIDYALLFLTDYFQFFNPKAKAEDIATEITVNPEWHDAEDDE